MSTSEQLMEVLSKRARRLRDDVELDEEVAEHIGELDSLLDKSVKSEAEMRAALKQIASIVHHGGLIGFADENACLNEVRRISLKWWDKKALKRT